MHSMFHMGEGDNEKFLFDWRRTIGELYQASYASVKDIAAEYGIEALAQIPVKPEVAAACDNGTIEMCGDGEWLAKAFEAVERNPYYPDLLLIFLRYLSLYSLNSASMSE